MKNTYMIMPLAALLLFSCAPEEQAISTFPAREIVVGDPLSQRIMANLSRLQDDIYLPPQVFEDKDWPGDFVGRTILGLTMDSEALHTGTDLLPMLIDSLPAYFNQKGYLGPDYSPSINEQQLSGHGWLLRGLCEYYRNTGDKAVLEIIESVSENLFVSNSGSYRSYPISSEERTNSGGEASGSIAGQIGNWILSTDIGCVFIGMAGLIDAYEFVPSKAIRGTIDEMIARFLEVDLTGIQAQTHATLSALRGLVKYARLTGDETLLEEVLKRWQVYVSEGMTCCYANLNWFGRPDSWTEPCAIVDSYIVAVDLWKATMDPSFRDMAELIEVNAIGHAQRSNGGFGCDSCPSEDNPYLSVVIPEAYWCCTMRGAEGLSRMAEYSWMSKGKTLYVPFFRAGALCADDLEVEQRTEYPDGGTVSIKFYKNDRGVNALMLPVLPWADNVSILLNDEVITPEEVDGMYCIRKEFVNGDKVIMTFDLPVRSDEWNGCRRFYSGPVMLGLRKDLQEWTLDDLEPVPALMQFMDSDRVRVLFQ